MPFWRPNAGAKIRETFLHPALALGSTVLWGILELIALQRSQRAPRRQVGKSRPIGA